MTTKELTSNIRKLKKLKSKAEEIAAQIASIEDEIKAEMLERDVEEITVDVFKVRYTTVISNRVDTTAIKKELPDIATRYTKQTKSRRFSIA